MGMEDKEFQLELSGETLAKLENYARKTGQSEDQVVEYILFEFLEKQARVIEKRSAETGKPVNELMNMQFERILDFLGTQLPN